MKIKHLQQLILALTVSVAILGAKAQAGGQCSKGSVCSSSTSSSTNMEDPKKAVDEERERSKKKFHAVSAELDKDEMANQTPSHRYHAERKSFDDHREVIKKWVSVHNPSLKESNALFRLKLNNALEEDKPMYAPGSFHMVHSDMNGTHFKLRDLLIQQRQAPGSVSQSEIASATKEHQATLKKWIPLRFPEIKEGTPEFDQKLKEGMDRVSENLDLWEN